MLNSVSTQIDILLFFIQLLITTSSLYAAWVDLVKQKISRFGFDAFILLFFSEKNRKMIQNNPVTVKRMGIMMILIALGGLDQSLSIFAQRIWPNIH